MGVCCHLDTDSAACRQGNGLIPVRKVTLTVLQEQGSMPLMDQFGVQCCLQLLFGARNAEQKIWGSLTPHRCTVLDHHALDLSIRHDLHHQQQSWHAGCSLHSAIHTNRKHLPKPANTVRRRDEAEATLHQLCKVAQDYRKRRGPAGSSFHAC